VFSTYRDGSRRCVTFYRNCDESFGSSSLVSLIQVLFGPPSRAGVQLTSPVTDMSGSAGPYVLKSTSQPSFYGPASTTYGPASARVRPLSEVGPAEVATSMRRASASS